MVIFTHTVCWIHNNLVGVGVIPKAGLLPRHWSDRDTYTVVWEFPGLLRVSSAASLENQIGEAFRKLRARNMSRLHFRRGQEICDWLRMLMDWRSRQAQLVLAGSGSVVYIL